MERSLKNRILQDMPQKIILITGPRQVGKTTLSQKLCPNGQYYNYDLREDKKRIHQDQVNFNETAVILDELHKMKMWKRWLKGHYDTRSEIHPIIVTGSAKLDTYKKVGDSLAGRFFQYRLMPLDIKEVCSFEKHNPEDVLDALMERSGFPEPFFSNQASFYKRWRKTHLDIILRQDLPQLELIKNLSSVEVLIELMTERAGNLLSYNSLREDLQTDDKSVKRWLQSLENSYVLFKVTPYSKKINRAILKAPKYYFYDLPRIQDLGVRFENLVALSLYKEILFRQDTLGEDYSLHFLRNTNQNEVDFLICLDKKPVMMIEAKLSDNNLDLSFPIFEKSLGPIPKVVLVKDLQKDYSLKDGTQVRKASHWLAQMKF